MNKQLLVEGKKWEDYNLSEQLIQCLIQNKFTAPSCIQDKFLTGMISKPNASGMVEAPTGTGKTISFLIKALQTVDPNIKDTQVAILAHTQMLCIQIQKELEPFARDMKITHSLCMSQTSGFMFVPRSQIIIGTTEAFANKFIGKQVRGKISSPECSNDKMKLLVIDEADYHFKNQDWKDRMSIIISQLNRQVLLFSATLDKEVAQEIQSLWLKNIKDQFKAIREEIFLDNTAHYSITASSYDEKLDLLRDVYKLSVYDAGFKSIVFCKTRNEVDDIASLITKEGYCTSRYHGQMENEEKDKQFKSFIKGETNVLITTDVLARGIDIITIAVVINFDPPTDRGPTDNTIAAPETYVHRIGRGGRFGRKSVALTFISGEQDKGFLIKIKDYIQNKFKDVKLEAIERGQLADKVSEALKGQTADQVEASGWDTLNERQEVKKREFKKKDDHHEKKDGETKKTFGDKKENDKPEKQEVVKEEKQEEKESKEVKKALPDLDFD